MRRIFVALLLLSTSQLLAGEQPWPGRYKTPPRGQGLVVQSVWGHPEIQPALGHTAVFAPDGTRALYASGGGSDGDGATDDSFLSLWDTAQGRLLHEVRFERRAVTAAALSPDGGRALVGLLSRDGKGNDKAQLVLVDLASGKQTQLAQHTRFVAALAFSADGKHAVSSSFDFRNGRVEGGIILWNLATSANLLEIPPHKDFPCLAVAFVPGTTQFLAGHGNKLQLFDFDIKKKPREFESKQPHGDLVMNLVVSPDGKDVLSMAGDNSLMLWDIGTGKEVAKLQKPALNSGMVSAAFTEGRKALCIWTGLDLTTAGQDVCEVGLWDGATGKEVWTRKGTFRGLTPVHVAKGGKQALVGGGANPFVLLDLADGREARIWGPATSSINAVLVVDKSTTISAGQDGTVKFWQKGRAVKTFRAHADAVTALAASRDGQFLVTASADKTLKLWDVQSGVLRKTFSGHTANVTAVAFAPDMHWIVSGSNDRTLKIWDVVTAKDVQTLTGHAEGVNAVALAPDASWVASASDDNTVRIWPLKQGRLDADRDVVVLEGHKRQVTALAVSPDGKFLLSGSQDKTLRLWDAKKGKSLQTLEGHGNWISHVTFLGNTGLAASTSDDLTVRLWDVFKGKEVGMLDVSSNSDCPRCLAATTEPRSFLIGTSGWVILQCTK